MFSWDAGQYLRFTDERTRPSNDLVSKIPVTNPKSIIDLGCGPGNSSEVLRKKYPNAKIVGIDNSEDMVISARKNHPEIDFVLGDMRDVSKAGNSYDIVFSNAALQWVPDNKKLIKGMSQIVNNGGVFAAQIPYNSQAKAQKIIDKTIKSVKWSAKLEEERLVYTLKNTAYYTLLTQNFSTVDMWETDYYHILDSHEDILNWYKGTALRFYLSQLDEYSATQFLDEIFDAIKKEYKVSKDGKVLFNFNRLFFIAKK